MSFKPRHALLVNSNGYKDRDKEYVSVAALTHYAKRFNAGLIRSSLPVNYYHKRDISKIIEVDMCNGFLLEIAEELPTRFAKARWDYIQATPHLKWGCSQEFFGTPDKDGIFRNIRKTASTILQRKHAANPLTAVIFL